MSTNNITSINHLVNNDESDEDRKFLRAAAEAIVATSMNNEIDPTILELLRRIQYANAPNPTGTTTSVITPGDPSSSTTRNPLEPLNSVSHTPNTINNFGSAGLDNGLNIAKNSHHFPTFNLNYFENIENNRSNSTNNNNNNNNHLDTDPASVSSWSISQQTPTPQSHTSSTPPSAKQPSSSIGETKPFICTDCTLSFRRSSDLRRHQRAHLPILPHICKMCGKGFARKDALKRHSDTLTCKRNREKLLSSGGDVESILEEAKKQGHDV